MDQELPTLSGAPEFTPVLSGVRVTRSLVLYVCFVDRCVSFCIFSFGHCVVCSSIYGFWLPSCYLQTILILKHSRFGHLMQFLFFHDDVILEGGRNYRKIKGDHIRLAWIKLAHYFQMKRFPYALSKSAKPLRFSETLTFHENEITENRTFFDIWVCFTPMNYL
jgi:hypothetical protein